MKFDYCIGNPPYQESRETTKDMPVYNDFMDAAYQIAERVELITPAKFLFNSGATPKDWNRARLNDKHFKVFSYVGDSAKVFPTTSIAGGVAIHYRDTTKDFGAIEIFSPFSEMNQIRNKVISEKSFIGLDSIMYPYSAYTLSEQFWKDFPERKKKAEYIIAHRSELSKEDKQGEFSNLRIITTNVFDLIPEVFHKIKPDDGNEYCLLAGRQNNQRCNQYILRKYIDVAENYDNYKVIISIADGASGCIGNPIPARLCGIPTVIGPQTGYTQTFQSIGNLTHKNEAENIVKYIKTKFARLTLGLLKATQHYPVEKWHFVPLQDYTDRSDIDWSKSIHEIDLQLYRKYALTKEEIEFIESHVKEMD